ncbi:MAG TPA: glycosyltransferase family protein [Terriglobales bacterium]|jgi:spore coat polysaccharide biosynthesis protein SpsF|nr:glycosyltransferase family protein [Terriglobales bacterium]
MKTCAIVQARMGSSRLPGKVLMDVGGETVLARVVNRLRRATLLDEILIATCYSVTDDAIVRECERLSVPSFRGPEDDVLDRYHQAAQACKADVVVRITSDCPLIDPVLVDETISVFQQQHADYASNTIVHTYPRGLDTEVFSRAALERAWTEARNSYEREHVTPYFYEHPELFRVASTRGHTDCSHFRWTLDTPEDLQLIRKIYTRFDNQDTFGWQEAVALMQREPELGELNSHVLQKSLHGV